MVLYLIGERFEGVNDSSRWIQIQSQETLESLSQNQILNDVRVLLPSPG